MSDVLVWIPGMFPDTRPLWLSQVSAVINLHHSKLPPIPKEGWREKWVAAAAAASGKGKKEEKERKEGGKEGRKKQEFRRGKIGKNFRTPRQRNGAQDR